MVMIPDSLLQRFYDETSLLSSTHQIKRSASYREILALGDDAIEELVDELTVAGPHHQAVLLLLSDLVDDNPAAGCDTVEQAIAVWLKVRDERAGLL